MLSKEKIQEILDEFAFDGVIKYVEYPYGEGHINDTILVETRNDAGKNTRYIIQKINKIVFTKPDCRQTLF